MTTDRAENKIGVFIGRAVFEVATLCITLPIAPFVLGSERLREVWGRFLVGRTRALDLKPALIERGILKFSPRQFRESINQRVDQSLRGGLV